MSQTLILKVCGLIVMLLAALAYWGNRAAVRPSVPQERHQVRQAMTKWSTALKEHK